MIFKRIKVPANWKKIAIPLIMFSFGLIMFASEKTEVIDAAGKTVFSQGTPTESDSKDVNPNSSSPNSAVWMVGAEPGQFSVKQNNDKYARSLGLERLGIPRQAFNFTKSENTLGQIHSDLGRQFTLLGEKPSGTS